MGGRLARIVTAAALLAMLAGSAGAQARTKAPAAPAPPVLPAKVVISAQTFADRLHVASMLIQRQGAAGVTAQLEELLLQGIYRKYPHAPPAKIVPWLRKAGALATAQTQRQLTADAPSPGATTAIDPDAETITKDVLILTLSLAATAAGNPEVALYMPLAVDVGWAAGKRVAQWWAAKNTPLVNNLGDQYSPAPAPLQDSAITQASREMARTPQGAGFEKAWDGLFAADAGHPLDASAADILASSDEIKAVGEDMGLVDPATGKISAEIRDPNGNITLGVPELRLYTGDEVGKLQAEMGSIEDEIVKVDNVQRKSGLIDYSQNAQDRSAVRAEVNEKIPTYQQEIDGAKAGVYLVSTFLGFGNAQFGKTVAAVGNATIAMDQSLTKWLDTIGSLGNAFANPVSQLATLTMTGNLIGAVLSIVSLFGGGTDTATATLLKLQELDQKLTNLGNQMESRFNTVDRSLSKIFTDLAALHVDLSDLRLSLQKIEKNMVVQAIEDQRGNLWDQIDQALGWKPKNHLTVLKGDDFYKAASLFHSYANRRAFNNAAIGSSDRLQNSAKDRLQIDAQAYHEFADNPFEYNVNVLDEYAQEALGTRPLWPGQLPNLRDWALGARAWVTFASQWPQYARKLDRSFFDDTIKTGTAYRNAPSPRTRRSCRGCLNATRRGSPTSSTSRRHCHRRPRPGLRLPRSQISRGISSMTRLRAFPSSERTNARPGPTS